MARPNSRATYQRRNEIARDQGFRGYGEKRRALDYARHGPLAGMFRDGSGIETINARNREHMRLVALFYKGYKLNPDDYTIGGDKYEWLNAIAEYNREAGEAAIRNMLSDHSRWLWDRSRI